MLSIETQVTKFGLFIHVVVDRGVIAINCGWRVYLYVHLSTYIYYVYMYICEYCLPSRSSGRCTKHCSNICVETFLFRYTFRIGTK